MTPFTRYQPIIDDWAAFQETVERPLPTTIWTNPLKTTPEQLQELMAQRGIPLEPLDWYPGAFRLPDDVQPGLQWEYMAGLFHVQEEVSLIPAMFLDLQPTDRVLDMCAAPGSKTAQMGVMMRNQGTIVANDRSAGRMRAARQVLNRMGLYNVTTITRDAVNLPRGIGLFDKVLADVPCTCEGTCRKSPSILRNLSVNENEKMARIQTAVLRKAVQLCKVGGRIVYSTCTFAPEENELVLDAILREFGDEILRIHPVSLPNFKTSSGLNSWNNQPLHPDLTHALRIWPHHNDTGGFFVAVLEKLAPERDPATIPTPQPVSEFFAEKVEPDPWLSIATERFGISPTYFDDKTLLRWGKRGAWLVNSDHLVPTAPKIDATGMIFMRTKGQYPKISTAIGQLYGTAATQNIVQVNAEQAHAFFARQDSIITPDQASLCTSTGYVILIYKNTPIGVAIYHEKSQTLESTFPKGWARPNVVT